MDLTAGVTGAGDFPGGVLGFSGLIVYRDALGKGKLQKGKMRTSTAIRPPNSVAAGTSTHHSFFVNSLRLAPFVTLASKREPILEAY